MISGGKPDDEKKTASSGEEYTDDVMTDFLAAWSVPFIQRLEDFRNGKSCHIYLTKNANISEVESTEVSKWIKKLKDKPLSTLTPREACIIGMHYLKMGLYDAKDYQKALHYFKKAENDDPYAKYFLGEMHAFGLGVPVNQPVAAILYQAAVDQDLACARYALGAMRYQGLGISEDIDVALSYLNSAARQGDINAKSFLAWACYNEEIKPPAGTEKISHCLQSLTFCARNGNAVSLAYLGHIIFIENQGKPTAKTLAYCRLAARFSYFGDYFLSKMLSDPEQKAFHLQRAYNSTRDYHERLNDSLLDLFNKNKNNPIVCYRVALCFKNQPDSPGKRKIVDAFNKLCEKDFATFQKVFSEAGDTIEKIKPLLNEKNLQKLMDRRHEVPKLITQHTSIGDSAIAQLIAEYDISSSEVNKHTSKERKIKTKLLLIEDEIWSNGEPITFALSKIFYKDTTISRGDETRRIDPVLKERWEIIQKMKANYLKPSEAWDLIHESKSPSPGIGSSKNTYKPFT